MEESKGVCVGVPAEESQILEDSRSVLDRLVVEGARRMLQTALEAEADLFCVRYESLRDERGRREIVRNGHLPKRRIVSAGGMLEIEQPRVRDRRNTNEAIRFSSSILPAYLRRAGKIEEFIPWLYLKGISTGDMSETLGALLGEPAKALSASVVVKLKECWSEEYDRWVKRDLSGKRYVYLWVDGIYFNVRLEEERQCILVVIGATQEGEKELIAIQDGYRESEASWTELLLDLKARGLQIDPEIAVGDGALGFWAALRKIYPKTKEQRCWVHKSANVLDKCPKSVQPRVKESLHEIWMAETKADASKAFDLFSAKYGAKYPKAVECLNKDREALLAFYDFPAQHWIHLRTTNPIESTFATVRLRHRRTKGNATRRACLVMVYKLVEMAATHWRALRGSQWLAQVVAGNKFVDGVLQEVAA